MAVARGYVDVASEELQGDTFLLPLGFVAVTIYAVFMLGHLTCVENRVNRNFYRRLLSKTILKFLSFFSQSFSIAMFKLCDQ